MNEESTHAFVLRIWIEPREELSAKPVWRGAMEHVESGERVYFDRVEEVGKHLTSYLEAIGIQTDKPLNILDQHLKPTVQGGSKP